MNVNIPLFSEKLFLKFCVSYQFSHNFTSLKNKKYCIMYLNLTKRADLTLITLNHNIKRATKPQKIWRNFKYVVLNESSNSEKAIYRMIQNTWHSNTLETIPMVYRS